MSAISIIGLAMVALAIVAALSPSVERARMTRVRAR
jgi:hypothetical protein